MKRAGFLTCVALAVTAVIAAIMVCPESPGAAVRYAAQQFASVGQEGWVALALALSAAFVAGLLALWASTSPSFWFWRLLPLVGWLFLMSLAGAPELVLLFAGQFATIAALGAARRGWMRRGEQRLQGRTHAPARLIRNWQFSLRDAFLWVSIVALCIPAIAGIGAAWNEFDSRYSFVLIAAAWVLQGMCCGFVCCLAAWTVFGSARPWSRVLISLLSSVGLGALLGFVYYEFLSGFWLSYLVTFSPMRLVVLLPLPTAVSLWMLQILWLGIWRLGGWQTPRGGKAEPAVPTTSHCRRELQLAARALLSVSLFLTTAVVGSLWWYLVRPVPIPPDAPGAERAAQLGSIREQMDWSGWKSHGQWEATDDDRERFVNLNAGRLLQLHTLLAGPCATRLTRGDDENASFENVRALVDVFDIQSRAAIACGDHGAATEAALDCFRLGSRAQRGGAITNQFVAHGIEDAGLALLVNTASGLDRQQWHSIDAELAVEERDWEPLDDVYAREYAEIMNANGWVGRFGYAVVRLLGTRETEPYRGQLERRRATTVAELRLLRSELAIRFYRQDAGNFPPSLAALVPNWLDEVPLDPFSGRPLVYRVDDEGYSLYSIGPNRIDDGGHAVRWTEIANDGDICLEQRRLDEIAEAEGRAEVAAAAANR